MLRKFDAARWIDLVKEHRVTNTFSAPTQLKRIVSLPADELAQADMSSMICLIANAAPVPYALKQEIIDKLGDGFLYEVYGSTELGVDTVLKPEDQLRKPGSCGKPYGGIEMKIVKDDGTDAGAERAGRAVRAHRPRDGRLPPHRRAAHRARPGRRRDVDSWKSVGDVAYVDDEGYVYICDRKKDMIISGGVNIYPAEIEAVLYAHPQVLDVAVFGIPDDEWGERVHAIVQAKAGETIDLDELRAFAEPRLANYKRPRDVRAPRRAAAHRLRQAAQARAARRVLAGPELRRMSTARVPTLSEAASKELLARYGVPVLDERTAADADARGRRRRRDRLPGRREAVRRRDRAQDRARPRAARAARRRRRARRGRRELLAAAPPDDGAVELLVAPMVQRHPRADRRARARPAVRAVRDARRRRRARGGARRRRVPRSCRSPSSTPTS